MQTKNGPLPPKNAPWGGVIERCEAVWVGWITAPARQAGLDPESLNITFHGVPLHLVRIDLKFGPRFYWQCPICQRRCEALYYSSGRVGCRRCLRLAYVSQSTRPFSEMGQLDRLMTRRFSRGRRWNRSRNQDALAGVVQEIRLELRRKIQSMIESLVITAGPAGD